MNPIMVQTVVAAAEQLSPTEQFEVIQALTRGLQQRYIHADVRTSTANTRTISLPVSVQRTPPVTNIADFAADFWPADETADAVNEYVAQQRATDRIYDLPERDVEL